MGQIVNFSLAAAALGYKSRSQLYRLRDDGALDRYLVPGASPPLLDLQPDGLPHLREHVAECVQLRVGNLSQRRRRAPAPAPAPAPVIDEWTATREWWSEWGAWRPEEELTQVEEDEHVAQIVAGMMGGAVVEITAGNVVELGRQIADARADVARGARWDGERWAAAEARLDAADCED
jgi:hypothetical protein